MKNRIHILYIGNSAAEQQQLEELLRQALGDQLLLTWINNFNEALWPLEACYYDLVFLDYRLDGRDTIELLRRSASTEERAMPVIMLADNEDHLDDLEVIRQGAADYLSKQELSVSMLKRSVRYAIERKKIEQRLVTLSHYDALTGLANRNLFYLKLTDGIIQSLRSNKLLALFFLDLDHFKEVNDSLGHPTGDRLLQEVAARLKKATRASDTVARLGGDEFAVIATNLNSETDITLLAQKLVSSFNLPFKFGSNQINTHTSIGIALCPVHGHDPDELLRHADLALYQAKAAGRNNFKFYDSELDARAQEYRALEQEMRHALQHHDFTLHYQPMFSTDRKTVIGVEALVRWVHKVRGMIAPGDFIPLAESSGLILPLGEQVLEMACDQINQWDAIGFPQLLVAVNLSPAQFADPDLVEKIVGILKSKDVDPQRIELEITENTLMETGPEVVELLTQLNNIGIKLAIDDFGTGYSSLSYLKKFPVHKLKIDRAFIKDVTIDKDDAIIARSIIQLGQAMNLEIIAEGVETEEQLAFLRNEGCEQVQGFLFAKPMSSRGLIDWFPKQQGCIMQTEIMQAG
ncbi:MAG: EAL domain-containing protein [Geopsychrobacter sp.]|nr:EAL domain-containing protein [Geopsychrobacter sp.]